jgi:hypothetical protein
LFHGQRHHFENIGLIEEHCWIENFGLGQAPFFRLATGPQQRWRPAGSAPAVVPHTCRWCPLCDPNNAVPCANTAIRLATASWPHPWSSRASPLPRYCQQEEACHHRGGAWLVAADPRVLVLHERSVDGSRRRRLRLKRSAPPWLCGSITSGLRSSAIHDHATDN